MDLRSIYTDRLILTPVTLEMTRSLINGSTEEVEKLGIKTDNKWPREDTMDILPIINRTLEKHKIPSGFELWMIVRKDNMKVVGDIGFYGRPNEKGEVEVGYGLVDEERGKGFGYEAAKAIVDWATLQEEVRVIKADGVLITNIPSIRILEKIGMKEVYRDESVSCWEIINTSR